MSSKKSVLSGCLLIGIPFLLLGAYFIVWEIVNDTFDEYFAAGIGLLCFGGTFILCGIISHKNYIISLKCHLHPERDSVGKCNYCFKSFCAECLTETPHGKYYCPNCMDYALEQIAQDQPQEEDEIDVSQIPLKSKTIALILCLFLWPFGLHMFYLGYSSKGAARLAVTLFASAALVMPGLGVIILSVALVFKAFHAIFDLFSIAGDMRDAYGRKLV